MRSGNDDGGILRPIRHGLMLQSGRPAEGRRPRFAISRNIHHRQFGVVYERDPERKAIASGHFTGSPSGIYHPDTIAPGRSM